MASPTTARWQQLGELLQARRVQLDPKFRNLQRFCQAREIHYRLAWDVENGKRTNYRDPTLLAIDAAYGLAPRSTRRFIDRDEPLTAAPGTVGLDGTPAGPRPVFADPSLQQVWDSAEGLPDDARRGVVELVRQIRAADERKAAAGQDHREGNGA